MYDTRVLNNVFSGNVKPTASLPHSVPKEVMENIFRFLGPRDILHGMLVNKTWKEILSQKMFWKWAKIRILKTYYSKSNGFTLDTIRKTECSERLLLVNTLVFTNSDLIPIRDLESIFKGITYTNQWQVKKMEIFCFKFTNLNYVKPEVFASGVSKLSQVYICGIDNLSISHRNLMFYYIANSEDTGMKSMKIEFGKLSDPRLDIFELSKALCRIHTVELFAELSEQDIITLATVIVSLPELSLKKLYLCRPFYKVKGRDIVQQFSDK